MILSGVLLMTVAAAPLPTQDWVDLERYAGRWYEIARLPNRFQEQCAGDVAASYTLRPDGRVTVVNECRRKDGTVTRAEGVARRADAKGPASRLKVRFAPAFLSFLPFVWGDYWIVELDRDYRHAVVGDPSRKYLWILSRRPGMDEATYASLVERARGLGFDASRLLRTSADSRSFQEGIPGLRDLTRHKAGAPASGRSAGSNVPPAAGAAAAAIAAPRPSSSRGRACLHGRAAMAPVPAPALEAVRPHHRGQAPKPT